MNLLFKKKTWSIGSLTFRQTCVSDLIKHGKFRFWTSTCQLKRDTKPSGTSRPNIHLINQSLWISEKRARVRKGKLNRLQYTKKGTETEESFLPPKRTISDSYTRNKSQKHYSRFSQLCSMRTKAHKRQNASGPCQFKFEGLLFCWMNEFIRTYLRKKRRAFEKSLPSHWWNIHI